MLPDCYFTSSNSMTTFVSPTSSHMLRTNCSRMFLALTRAWESRFSSLSATLQDYTALPSVGWSSCNR